MIQAPGRAGVRLDQANQLWPTSASVFLNPHLPLQQRVPSSLSLGGGLGQPKPAPRHEHTQSHTRTHCDLQNTLPACLALCPPLASQPIESCPLQETQASPGSEAPPTTTRMAHHHRASLSEGPGPSPDGNPDDNRDWSSVWTGAPSSRAASVKGAIGSSEEHKTLDLMSMPGWGQRGGTPPARSKGRHTKAAPHTTGSHTQASSSHQGVRERCSKSCAIFYPRIRVRCQI